MTADDLAALDRQVQANEGWRPYLYDDATGKRITQGSIVIGHPTIGFGMNLDALDLPLEIGTAWFELQRTRVINELFNALPWTQTLAAGPLRVLVDISYNAGIHGLLGFHQMLGALQRGDLVTAQHEVINSALAPGRAQRLAKLIQS